MNDIDLSSYANWTPIGNYGSSSTTRTFQGNFNGNEKVVHNLTITASSNYQGLFGRTSGTVQNLGVENCSVGGSSYVGGLARYISRVCGYNEGICQKNYALSSMTVRNGNGNVSITNGSNIAGTAQTLATLKSRSFYATASNWQNSAWSITDPSGIWKICDGVELPFLR